MLRHWREGFTAIAMALYFVFKMAAGGRDLFGWLCQFGLRSGGLGCGASRSSSSMSTPSPGLSTG